jgi:hypothetical protein
LRHANTNTNTIIAEISQRRPAAPIVSIASIASRLPLHLRCCLNPKHQLEMTLLKMLKEKAAYSR